MDKTPVEPPEFLMTTHHHRLSSFPIHWPATCTQKVVLVKRWEKRIAAP